MYIQNYFAAAACPHTIGTSFDTNWHFLKYWRTRAAAMTWHCDATKCIICRAHVGFLSKVFVKSDLESDYVTGLYSLPSIN